VTRVKPSEWSMLSSMSWVFRWASAISALCLSVLFGGFQKGTNSAAGLSTPRGGPHIAARLAG
jgi:hypothetical protein